MISAIKNKAGDSVIEGPPKDFSEEVAFYLGLENIRTLHGMAWGQRRQVQSSYSWHEPVEPVVSEDRNQFQCVCGCRVARRGSGVCSEVRWGGDR